MSVFAAKIIVVLLSVYLIGLGVVALARADAAKRYLLAHAASPFSHYLELAVRGACGWAILTASPYMLASDAFKTVGWVILITTAVILVLPWRVHHRFANWSVPRATQYMKVIAMGSAVAGLILAYALVFGSAIDPAEFGSGTGANRANNNAVSGP